MNRYLAVAAALALSPRRSSALERRGRLVRALLAIAAALVATSVLLAIAADLPGSADRIRPLSELVDGGLDALRGLGAVPLAVGGLLVAVLYALAAAAIGHRRRHPRR